jgi:hypothetical protein
MLREDGQVCHENLMNISGLDNSGVSSRAIQSVPIGFAIPSGHMQAKT